MYYHVVQFRSVCGYGMGMGMGVRFFLVLLERSISQELKGVIMKIKGELLSANLLSTFNYILFMLSEARGKAFLLTLLLYFKSRAFNMS